MRRFNSSALRNIGATATMVVAAGFAVSVANAATLTLAQHNGGPSSGTIPSGDDSTVATFLFPREVLDTSVATTLSGTLNGTAGANSSLTVETTGGGGVRNRSRAVIPNFGQYDDDAALHLIANSNAAADADDPGSFILLARSTDIASFGTSITDMMTYIGAGTEGTEFFTLEFTSIASLDTDAEVTEGLLNAGIDIPLDEFWGADPDGGGGLTANSYRFNNAFDIFLVAIDTDSDGVPEVVTEWGCIQRTGSSVLPALAATGNDSMQIENISILANHQLIDDSGENPADTVEAGLDEATDFLVGTNASGAGAQALSSYLNGLAGGPYTVAGITVDGTGDSDFNRIINIDVNPDITDAAAIADIRSRFIGFTVGLADGSAGEVNSVAGGLASNSTFAQMGLAGDIEVEEFTLLQGSGPNFDGDTFEVWGAMDLSATPTNTGGANPAQFVLVATDDDGNDVVVAFGVTVQATLPTNTEVIGIDDEDQDGTADDNVIEEASDRVFVQFFLNDGDYSVNSDGTWSPEGGISFMGLDERFPLRLEIDTDETPLLGNALGATIASDTEADVEDLARPILAAVITQATTTGLCEFVGTIKAIFDESVSSLDAGQMGLAFDPGVTISDLTTGLDANLGIPEIDSGDADDFADQLLAINGAALATMYVSNDSVTFTAPTVPVDGTANDGTTSILVGTGDADVYLFGINVNAVEGAEGLGNSAVGTFDMVDGGEMTAEGGEVSDGAAPALLGAFGTGNPIFDVTVGFSEGVFNPNGFDEVESMFLFFEDGVRVAIDGADFDGGFGGDNRVFIEGLPGLDSETVIEVAVFNPGAPIEDADGNRIDPVTAKTKLVELGLPAATFKDDAVAFVDDETNLVTTIVLKTTGEVEADGTLSELLERFFIQGDDFGGDNGDYGDLVGLVESIDIGTEERADGCYLFVLTMVEGCELGQEDFFVGYRDSTELEDPATTLVDATNGSEVPSEFISVDVARPSTPSPEGNPIGETYVGLLDLGGEDEDALGAEIAAYVFKSVTDCGDLRFVYKGVTYVGSLGVDGLFATGTTATIPDGTVVYFHPQLKGDGDSCEGNLSPCGIINSKPDLDIYQVAELETDGDTELTEQVLLYQNIDSSFVVKPIALTLRRDTTTPGRFNVTGAGISNGTLTFEGGFEFIGNTFITGDADANGARPYTLHTRGAKDYLGCPVVFVVCPDDNFSDVEPFLANNLLVRRVTFAADNQADVATGVKSFTFANNQPIVFNINADFVHPYRMDQYVQDDWMFFPASASSPTRSNVSGAGQDFGTTATRPNPVVVPTGTGTATAPFNSVVAFPSGTTARGFFVMLDEDDKEPIMPDIATALALDTRGVYCGSARGLNRIATGYAYALEFNDWSSDWVWFTFGTLAEDISGASQTITPNSTNGGWHLLVNTRGDAITSSNAGAPAGNQIVMSMTDEEGVLIFIEGQPTFSDFESVPANDGYLLFTDTQFVE